MKQASLQLIKVSFSFKRRAFDSLWLVGFFCLFGFLLSVTRIFGESPDYFNYNAFFDLARREGFNTLVVSRFEPGFSVFSVFLTKLFTSNIVVYSWIVAATLFLKGWTIRTYSPELRIFIVVAVFYFARYLPLHELTQLRAACGVALALVGALLIWRGDFYLGILIFVLALAFHVSAAALIPALFLHTSSRWKAIFIACATFISILVFFRFITGYLANFILILEAYQSSGFEAPKPNPFSIQLLIDWAIIFASFVMWSRLTLLMKRIVLLEMIGMAVFYGASEFAVVAHRMRELYSVFWIFFVAEGLRIKSTRLISGGFIFVCIVFYSYLFVIGGAFFS